MIDNLRQSLVDYMGRTDYVPKNRSELARALEVPSKERSFFRELIGVLEDEKLIIRLKKGTYALRRMDQGLIEGKIRILRSGKALFLPDKPEMLSERFGGGRLVISELPVQSFRLMSAMDGDRVAARIEMAIPKGWNKRNKGRPSLNEVLYKVRIEKILERGRKLWVGVYKAGRAYGVVLGDGVMSPATIELTKRPPQNLIPGQVVVVEPESWGEGKSIAKGYIKEVLGWSDEAGVDIEIIIRKYQLPLVFPEQVVEAVEALPDDLDEENLKGREDWTDQGVITIDPEDARDFDDAVFVKKVGDQWELAVHIADVSHYVRPGTALDVEAMSRGNSTYLPDRVIPMLPPRLSDDLCSLREGVVRLTKVCVMRFNKKGDKIQARFADAYITSRRRLSYAQALMMMKGEGGDEVSTMLKEAWNLASLLRKNRMDEGALDLDFPDVRVLLDDKGVPLKVITEEYDESHQLIEEFMLAANESVAEALKNASRPAIYRVHEEPDEAKLNEFGELCKLYGHPVHDLKKRSNLISLLRLIEGEYDEQMLKRALLRSMMRARYDVEPIGHYGLSKVNYCHFTSPIRRYADLVVHRSLNSLTGKGKAVGSIEQLGEIAEHISLTERVSADAERDAYRVKLFEWLDNQTMSEEPENLEALVTEIFDYGFFVEIPTLQIKGLVKQRELIEAGWYYERFVQSWIRHGNDRIQIGCKIVVVPRSVDRQQQWVDFALIKVNSNIST